MFHMIHEGTRLEDTSEIKGSINILEQWKMSKTKGSTNRSKKMR